MFVSIKKERKTETMDSYSGAWLWLMHNQDIFRSVRLPGSV